MAVKSEVNRSAAIRDLYDENPNLTVTEAVDILADKGIVVKKGLVYLVKNKMHSKKRRQAKVKKVVAVSGNGTGVSDALATIKKIKVLAGEVGGLKQLQALVEALI